MLYANVCLFLLQQSKMMTNTVHNIPQNHLKGTACSKNMLKAQHGKLKPNKQQQTGILT